MEGRQPSGRRRSHAPSLDRHHRDVTAYAASVTASLVAGHVYTKCYKIFARGCVIVSRSFIGRRFAEYARFFRLRVCKDVLRRGQAVVAGRPEVFMSL